MHNSASVNHMQDKLLVKTEYLPSVLHMGSFLRKRKHGGKSISSGFNHVGQTSGRGADYSEMIFPLSFKTPHMIVLRVASRCTKVLPVESRLRAPQLHSLAQSPQRNNLTRTLLSHSTRHANIPSHSMQFHTTHV